MSMKKVGGFALYVWLLALGVFGTFACGDSSSTGTQGPAQPGPGELAPLVLTLKPLAIPPGGEYYRCQNFANPFGEDTFISGFESKMTQHSHHLLVFFKDYAKDTELEECSGVEFESPSPYATQLQDDSVSYPPGIAMKVRKTQGFRLQVHYINPSKEYLKVNVTVTLRRVKPETVTEHAGQLFVVEPKIDVAPRSTAVITHTCELPFDMKFLVASSHMHSHGTHFVAKVDDTQIVENTSWDNPRPNLYEPPHSFKKGQKLQYSCTFDNQTDTPLTFGESALNNEMCVFYAQVFPVPDALNGGAYWVTCD